MTESHSSGDREAADADFFENVQVQDLIHDVYTTTAPQVRHLRNTVVQMILNSVDQRDLIQSTIFRKFLPTLPSLAAELALFKLSPCGALCTECTRHNNVIVGVCACGKVNRVECRDDGCREEWCEQSRCSWCYGLGTLQYPLS